MITLVKDDKIYVTKTLGICGGRACIAGTRVSVELVAELIQGGDTPDDIVAAMPHLTLSQVHGALAYYYDHRDEIDKSIEDGIGLVEQLRAKSNAV